MGVYMCTRIFRPKVNQPSLQFRIQCVIGDIFESGKEISVPAL